jgi:hypothetical protein
MTTTTATKPFPPLLLVLAGMLMGSSNGALSFMEWFRCNAESILLTLYTVSVAFYLTWVASREHIQSAVNSLFPPKKIRVHTATPATTKPEEPQLVSAAETDKTAQAAAAAEQPVNLSGAYKLQSNDGFEEFLAVQGVPWALRRAANSARPTHRITHLGNILTIKIEGIIESQTTYVIGGPPVETNIRGRIFEDSVAYLKDGEGIVVSKRPVTEDYDVTVQRELSQDKQQITMISTAFFRDGRDPVKSLQIFKRVE